ncbi:MAG TPA: hypothetical protein PLQ64_10500 [Thiobacillaceae bacterium]|nr:hypothetical protein [Thiobacillaceae bacterium]
MSGRHPFPRWLSVVLRGLHLATVIGLGAALLGAPLDAHAQSMGVLISGAAMMALDLWMKPQLVREWSGAALFIKLGVVGWMALDATLRVPLFWALVAWSAVFAHAPASFRHAPWLGRPG